MPFEKVESWALEEPSRHGAAIAIGGFPRLPFELRGRAVATLVTLCVHALLFLVVVDKLSEEATPVRLGTSRALTLVDLDGKQESDSEAVEVAPEPPPVAPVPPVLIALPATLPVPEWRAVTMPAAAPAAPKSSSATGTGGTNTSSQGASGSGGSGYDPYAGAAYRPAGSVDGGTVAAAERLAVIYLPQEVDRAELVRLLLALDRRLPHIAFSLQVTVGRDGRAVKVQAVAPASPPAFLKAKPAIEAALVRQRLLRPDPSTPSRDVLLGPFELGTH